MNITFYKIKNTVTGLYSSGGSHVRWSQKGKEWSKRGYAIIHMANAVGYRHAEDVYKDAVLVEFSYEYNPVVVSETPLIDIIEAKNRKAEENAKRNKELREKLRYKEAKEIVNNYENGKIT